MAETYATARSGGRMPPYAPSRKMGAWKLAYADFLTALCAFFLVMWMINTPQSEREGVAEYFSGDPAISTYTTSVAPQADTIVALLEASRELQAFDRNLAITKTNDFVRFDLFDTSDRPLFSNGEARFNTIGESLTAAAGRVISINDWQISVEGHTDSKLINRNGYSNWDLSSERANTARRALQAAGVDASNFRAVTGFSDTRPLFPEASHLPANRRISIVIHLLD